MSSCEAEIVATTECTKCVEAIKLVAHDLNMTDGSTCTPVYNDNASCVQWAASVTSKGIKHLNLQENKVRELQQSARCHIRHIPGSINPCDIFTKEIRDGPHFRSLRDCMMVSKSVFTKYHQPVPTKFSAKRTLNNSFIILHILSPVSSVSRSHDLPDSSVHDRGVLGLIYNAVTN